MRTISAALEAAQRDPSREPYVAVTVENVVGGVRRLDFSTIDNTAQTIADHDAAIAGDGSMTRVRIDAGTLKQQRIADPLAGPFNAWNNLVSPVAGVVACSADGARVAVVYVDNAGTGIKLRESLDNGQTYGGEVAVVTSPAAVVAVAVAYKVGTTDLAIAWCTATELRIIRRTAGVFGAASLSPEIFTSLNGVAMCYGFDWDMLVTGAEIVSARPTLWTHIFGDGGDHPAATWGALQVQQQVEADADITFQAPSLAFLDTYRATFVEVDAFTGGTTRTWRTYLPVVLLEFDAGAHTWATPAPTDYTQAQGLALSAGASAFETAADVVRYAPRGQALRDVSADVLAIELDESTAHGRGHVDLDNSHGGYTGIVFGVNAVTRGNLVVVRFGYRTTAGLQASQLQDFELVATERHRQHGRAVFRLVLAGGLEVLRRNRQRHQVVHTADDYRTVIARIFARAGYSLTFSGASSRSDNVLPLFTVHPQTSAYDALQQALALLADRIVMRSNASCIMNEPLPGDAADYTFDSPHTVRDAVLREEPDVVASVQVFGADVYGEALDLTVAGHHLGARVQLRDRTSDAAGEAAASAVAHLRQRQLDEDRGELVVQPHVGLEPLDVVALADTLLGAGTQTVRVQRIRWRYDRRRNVYDQRIGLGTR